MEEKILELREKRFTIEQIAERLGITVGQVKYRLYKKSSSFVDQKTEVKNNKMENRPLVEPELSPYYGENEIVMMVQGPSTLYIYWEITWPMMRVIADYNNVPFEHLQKILRVYDVTDIWFNGRNDHWHRDIMINNEADNWFIYDIQPGRTYLCDLGIGWQGRFVPVLRSKAKSTPHNQQLQNSPRELYQVEEAESQTRIKPHWFENFSTYTLY